MWKHSHAALKGNQGNMQVALLDMPRQVCAPFDVGTLGSFVGQSSSVQTILIQSDEELIRKLFSMLDNQVLAVLESRSVSESIQKRSELWSNYVRARRALWDTMTNLTSPSSITAAIKISIATLQQTCKSSAVSGLTIRLQTKLCLRCGRSRRLVS